MSGMLFETQCILQRYTDVKPRRFWSHDLDRFGSHDVIGHVTIRLAVVSFL